MKLKKTLAALLALLMLAASSCSPINQIAQLAGGSQQSGIQGDTFAEAHDAFQTTLTRQDNDSDPIPDPPEGVFDLVYYPSKVGDLAAYVSSDPGDGEKHPLIIWVVGGWGNGIDDFPFCYPAWDDDQTGSAFWRAGVLTMYPSFRGGVGNPGYYEALFGEVDDIVSAYEYAASLPYVDPDRIYLGGHSTGGTRALLASEYTDKFRAVFCFGAVDEVKYHNNSWFTFDTSNEEEFTMRSPIHWLKDVKSPTFLIEGSEGNAANLRNIQKASTNENIHCYIVDGADHWEVLAPITPLLAQKILADTGASCSITVTQEELEAAMEQDPVIPDPVMVPCTVDELGMTFSCPYIWEVSDLSEDGMLLLYLGSPYDGDNSWDMTVLYVEQLPIEEGDLSSLRSYLESEGFEVTDTTLGGLPAYNLMLYDAEDSEDPAFGRCVMLEKDGCLLEFNFYSYESYGDSVTRLLQNIIDSVQFA